MKKLCSFLLIVVAGSLLAQSQSASQGVYTAEQAARGRTAAAAECGRCHGGAFTGGESAPALIGADFLSHWTDSTLADLDEKIRTTMPTDSPGSLSKKQYTDILAFILSANNFPAGTKELSDDKKTLSQISLKPQK